MREQRRACAVLGLGPFAQAVLDGLPDGAITGPIVSLRLGTAGSRAGHDWLPMSLRAPAPPSLVDTRPGGRLDVLAAGRSTLRAHEPTLRAFSDRCRDAGVPAALIVVAGLFDTQAAGLLDLAAMLRASESLGEMQIVLLAALSPPADRPEPQASARAALSLQELSIANSGAPWELPQPSGVLSSPQSGSSMDASVLVWPSGVRWSQEEAVATVLDVLASLPWLPELPEGGLGAARAVPVRAPAVDVRDRLADRLAALAVDRWLAPGVPVPPLAQIEARALAGAPVDGGDWLDDVRSKLDGLVKEITALAGDAPDAAADRVRGEVPAFDRAVSAELGARGALRAAVDDGVRRWVAGVQAQGLAIADELCATADGGGFALIALAQQVPERLAALRDARDQVQQGATPGEAREVLDVATEALRVAIDKPVGLSVRLLGRGAPRLLEPLQAWRAAADAWATAHWTQTCARAEATALRRLTEQAQAMANRVQEFEVTLRAAAESVRASGRAANQQPLRGVVVLPGGAVDPDEAAEKLEHLGGEGRGAWLSVHKIGTDPAPILRDLRERLRLRLGAAEAQLTLGGALASLPDDGPSRAALDRVIAQVGAPLLGGEGREELVAILPPDVEPGDLRLPLGARVVVSPRREDALLVRVAGGFDIAALGLRKAALDEGLSRLTARSPSSPDLLWRRFPPRAPNR